MFFFMPYSTLLHTAQRPRNTKWIIAGILVLLSVFFMIVWPLSLRSGAGEVRVHIAKGSSVHSVAETLVQIDVLPSKDVWIFELAAKLTNADRRIRAGDYVLLQDENILDLLTTFTSQNENRERSLTFIEGWDLRDIAKYLVRERVIQSPEELYKVTGVPARVYVSGVGAPERTLPDIDLLETRPENISVEGFIFPDTYRIFADATVDEILEKAMTEMSDKVKSITDHDVTSKKFYKEYSFFEVLTMASIIEAEVRGTEDRRKVADIIWRRLEQGWPLQMDSTVNYITEKNTPSASAKDIKNTSPYNTYKHRGLPPGPINNPSLDSIRAAMNPLQNNYWFFLTSKDGKVYYGRTLEEHAANRKYL
jgi:UPF0755 protein